MKTGPNRKSRFRILIFLLLGVVGLVLSPLILMFGADVVGWFINPPFSVCKVMDKAQLAAAISNGFKVNAGCCAERMFGECSIATPNSTALVNAVEGDRMDAVEGLLDQGADVNKTSDMGDALTVAARLGRGNMIEALLSHGATPQSQIGAIRIGAHEGHTDIVTRILGRVAPDHLPEACSTLLCGLVNDLQQHGSPSLPRQRELFLHAIRTCPDPNILCDPYRLLTSIGRDDHNAPLFKALLEKGADLDAREKSGRTVREFLGSFTDYNSRPKIKALIEGDG